MKKLSKKQLDFINWVYWLPIFSEENGDDVNWLSKIRGHETYRDEDIPLLNTLRKRFMSDYKKQL